MRLLVVEDDSALSSLLVRALREESYAVDLAQDGQEAEWLTLRKPELGLDTFRPQLAVSSVRQAGSSLD